MRAAKVSTIHYYYLAKLTFAELPVHLASQDVEQIRWFSHVSDLHVAVLVLALQFICCRKDARIFIAELKISFHAARRMLRSLSVVAVG